ncbi:class I adenylate-forming enzyme family protein [Bradyrhizobium iriomotense]|uniref:class I adenylate-forming enzyme family protein n=1 Tax=Bradyrhizobium iriomotense TaxID=441950 RepID=UPI001B8A478A|nr:AMP-binding protein [Bradyrhizobium iriomotense]MBR0781910.1 AMP-binding protein [Bradyrhizobium iriomotense]
MNKETTSASQLSLSALFAKQCRLKAHRTAVVSAGREVSYAQLDERSRKLQSLLASLGCTPGDRVCILSENSPLFLELAIAAIRLKLIVSTLNFRLSAKEIRHCVELVQPKVTIVSTKLTSLLADTACGEMLETGELLDRRIEQCDPMDGPGVDDDPEAGLFIIYTSGTTGLPKGALISRRAILARLMVYVSDYGVDGGDTFLAWSPLCHMASVELGLGTLLLGGKVVVLDGADLPVICDYLESDSLSNLIFFPGMVEQTLAYLRERRPQVKRLKKFGAMADLFAPQQIADLTSVFGVPFTNTFGSTETGMPPASAGRLATGEIPTDLGKTESLLCEVSLVDDSGTPVLEGQPGELVMRGPTLFSGYWNAPDATRDAFRGGWYHTGDVFVRRTDGRLSYVDRSKYLIKSGGENIYPAEIERVALQHPKIVEAVVVRQPDPRWGEVPVLVVASESPAPSSDELIALCRDELASYKRPKRVMFVSKGSLPRNNTGKILRSEVEAWVAKQPQDA